MKSFLSLLSERREMRASENAVLGLGVGSKPRSSRTGVVCATVCATPHVVLKYLSFSKTLYDCKCRFSFIVIQFLPVVVFQCKRTK